MTTASRRAFDFYLPHLALGLAMGVAAGCSAAVTSAAASPPDVSATALVSSMRALAQTSEGLAMVQEVGKMSLQQALSRSLANLSDSPQVISGQTVRAVRSSLLPRAASLVTPTSPLAALTVGGLWEHGGTSPLVASEQDYAQSLAALAHIYEAFAINQDAQLALDDDPPEDQYSQSKQNCADDAGLYVGIAGLGTAACIIYEQIPRGGSLVRALFGNVPCATVTGAGLTAMGIGALCQNLHDDYLAGESPSSNAQKITQIADSKGFNAFSGGGSAPTTTGSREVPRSPAEPAPDAPVVHPAGRPNSVLFLPRPASD